MSNYLIRLTDIGRAKDTNSLLPGNAPLDFFELAVGDGEAAPDYSANALQNEVWRGAVTGITPHPDQDGLLIITGVIPSDVGGFTIRELGFLDQDGDLIALVKTAEVERLDPAIGQLQEQHISCLTQVVNAAEVQLLIDPSIIYATKADLDALRKDLTPSPIEQEWRLGWQ